MYFYTLKNVYKIIMAKKEKIGKLTYSKELSIQYADKFLTEIKKVFKQNKKIEISVKDVETVDLTFIQLLYSLKKSSEKAKKTISFDIKMNKELEKILFNAGLVNLF